MIGGTHGKILHVNLSTGEIEVQLCGPNTGTMK